MHAKKIAAAAVTVFGVLAATAPSVWAQSAIAGVVITAYNLSPAKLSLTQRIDTNASSDREQIFNGFELAMNARLQNGITIFGGTSHQRTVMVTCDQPDDQNLLRFCDFIHSQTRRFTS